MPQPLRNTGEMLSGGYRYSFNGMEKDDELYGAGNSYDFGARIYNPRLGRWMSPDPQFVKQTSWSPYKAMYDNPIVFIDPDGELEIVTVVVKNQQGEILFTMTYVNSCNLRTTGSYSSGHTVTGTTNRSHTNWYHYERKYEVIVDDEGKVLSTDKTVTTLTDVVVYKEVGTSYAKNTIKEIDSPIPFEMKYGIVFFGKRTEQDQEEKVTAKNETSVDYALIEALTRINKGLKGIDKYTPFVKIDVRNLRTRDINKQVYEAWREFSKYSADWVKSGETVTKAVENRDETLDVEPESNGGNGDGTEGGVEYINDTDYTHPSGKYRYSFTDNSWYVYKEHESSPGGVFIKEPDILKIPQHVIEDRNSKQDQNHAPRYESGAEGTP